MGKIPRFRRSRRWTNAHHYGAPGRGRDEVTLRGVARETLWWLGKFRPYILGAILLSMWPALDPALVEPPAFLATEAETIDEHFTRCGRGRGHACVIDGDTIKIGQRKVRIIGIDAPEVHGVCTKEVALAEAATVELQRLLNQGPFEMTGRFDDSRDLRALSRARADGTIQSIAEDMRASGLARRYLGGFKAGWC